MLLFLHKKQFFNLLLTGKIVAAFGLAVLVGGMLFFAGIVAPLVFTQLPPDVAFRFIRTMFPFYYAYLAGGAVIAGGGFLLRGQKPPAITLLLILLAVLWAWLWLIPHLDAVRAAGDQAAFRHGHRLSVWLNAAEFCAAFWLLIRLVTDSG